MAAKDLKRVLLTHYGRPRETRADHGPRIQDLVTRPPAGGTGDHWGTGNRGKQRATGSGSGKPATRRGTTRGPQEATDHGFMSWQGGTRRGEHRDTGDRGIPRATGSGDGNAATRRRTTGDHMETGDQGRPWETTGGYGPRIQDPAMRPPSVEPQGDWRPGDHGTQRPREITGRRFRIWQRGHPREDHGEPLGDGRPRETTRDHGPRIQDRHPQGGLQEDGDHRIPRATDYRRSKRACGV